MRGTVYSYGGDGVLGRLLVLREICRTRGVVDCNGGGLIVGGI